MEKLAGKADVYYGDGYKLDSDDIDDQLISEAKDIAIQSDVAVVFAGLPDRYESEGYDRTHLHIPANHQRLIEAISEVQPNVIVVLSNGAPIEMPWLKNVKGLLEAYLGGQAFGGAVADVLFGEVKPSGKLAETFPQKLSHNPSHLNFPGEGDKVEYKEGIFAQDLRDKLAEDNMHLKTGFVGTPYFAPVLSEMGSSEDAYTLLLNEDYPSWLYAVKLGAITIWERWNSVLPDGSISQTGMNSLNHYSYGSIVEWMYRYMCGINPVEHAPGYREILFTPRPDRRLAYAKATLNSATGRIETGWKFNSDDSLAFTFKVPFNTKATVVLPNAFVETIVMKDKNGVTVKLDLKQNGENVHVELFSGEFTCEYMPTKNYNQKFNSSNTVREIIGNNKSRSYFHEVFPEINEYKSLLGLVVNKRLDELADDHLVGKLFYEDKLSTFLNNVNK